jgi:hypothetical protein
MIDDLFGVEPNAVARAVLSGAAAGYVLTWLFPLLEPKPLHPARSATRCISEGARLVRSAATTRM